MRLRLLTALVAITGLAAGPAFAQRAGGEGSFLIGLAGGATTSDFSNPDTESRWGYTAGLWIGKPTYRSLAMLEVNWVQKGGEDTRLDYLEVPLTFGGLARTRNGVSRARFYTGIAAAFEMGCESSIAAVCNNMTSVEWTVPIGLMIGRYNQRGRVVALDVRYLIPLSEAFDSGTFGGAWNQNWQFRLMIGWAGGRR